MRRGIAKWLSGLGAMVLIGIPVLAMAEPWDNNLPSSGRFQVLATFQNKAVLDKNTGLVWEQAPNASLIKEWNEAKLYCVNQNVGNTRGWRLPSVAELASVTDPKLPPPFVPASVFPSVQSLNYWSASWDPAFFGQAWGVNFGDGTVSRLYQPFNLNVWCVRGATQESYY